MTTTHDGSEIYAAGQRLLSLVDNSAPGEILAAADLAHEAGWDYSLSGYNRLQNRRLAWLLRRAAGVVMEGPE